MEREATHGNSPQGSPSRQTETYDNFESFRGGRLIHLETSPPKGCLARLVNTLKATPLSKRCQTPWSYGFASSSFDEYAHVTGGNMLHMSADAIS
jgi:hypothetical protein